MTRRVANGRKVLDRKIPFCEIAARQRLGVKRVVLPPVYRRDGFTDIRLDKIGGVPLSANITSTNIVLLIANGFNEAEFADVQRALLKAGATIRTVAPENSLANGWLGKGWGHYFPVDQHIGDALGSDFDMMVVVGGARGVAKLQQNPHTLRLVGHFLDAEKPIVVMNEAISLLSQPGRIQGRRVSGVSSDAQLAAAGAAIEDAPAVVDRALLTLRGDDVGALVESMLHHFAETQELVAA